MTTSPRRGYVLSWPMGSEGVHVNAVLGVSMTPTSLGLVVVGGDDDDNPGDRDAFEVRVDEHTDVREATAAVEAIAAARGHRLKSIGVTWSDDADVEASLLMESLSESGFDNVVPIRLPEATEALARGMADVIGYQTTAVCVIEPDSVIALVVHTGDGAVQTAFNHNVDSDETLIGWLSTVFTRADWQPEALVLVGTAGDFDSVLPRLQEALSVPVYAPAEAPLALARGAALASTHSINMPFDENHLLPVGRGRHAGGRRSLTPSAALTTLLIAGLVTFVISVSVAVSAQLLPRAQVAAPEPAATSADLPAAVKPAPPLPPPAPAPVAPVIGEPVAEVAPIDTAPPAEVGTLVDAAPVEGPAETPYQAPIAADVPQSAPEPAAVAPVLPPVAPPQVLAPATKKPLLERIRDRLRPGG